MREEFIIRVLDRTWDILNSEQVAKLRIILEEELYDYELHPVTRALVPITNINEKIFLYLAAKRLDGLSPHSLKSYKIQLTRFSRFIQKDIENITTMDIRMYMTSYAKTGVKNSTMSTMLSALKAFFTWLEDEEYILKSPLRKIKAIKTNKYVRKALTAEEFEMLRDAASTNLRDRALVEFFYSTGCRLDEVQPLNKSSIDWSTSRVIVLGKGRKERPVRLNAKAKVSLWKYLNSRTDNDDALFVSERQPHARLGRRAIERTFSELGAKAGITKPVYPHLMRHTTASNMLNNGASLAVVQRYLGHESPVTTQIYAQLNVDTVMQEHEKNVI